MKKLVALMLVAALSVVSLTACGGTTDSGTSGSTTAASNTAATAAANTTTANTAANTTGTAAASGSGDTFLIGGIGPLTGAAASYGISVKQGAQTAIDEINAAGGVTAGGKTYKFAMQFEDDEATEDKAITAYNTLMDAGINVLMGAVTSGACLAIVDQTAADGILQITPSGSSKDCTKNSNAFRICFTDPMQAVQMADYIVTTKGLTKIAVIYNTADEYSSGINDAFTAEVKAKGGEVVDSEAFQTDDKDFNSQLTNIKKSEAQAIFVPAYYQDATYITKQAKELGITLPFFGSDGWDGVLSTVTDTSTVEGATFLSPFYADSTDAAVQKFVAAYKAAYNATPDQFAADGYDCVYTFKAALEKAGSTDNKALIDAMTQISVDGVTGTGITWTADGEPNKAAKFIQIVGGKYTQAQ